MESDEPGPEVPGVYSLPEVCPGGEDCICEPCGCQFCQENAQCLQEGIEADIQAAVAGENVPRTSGSSFVSWEDVKNRRSEL